MLTKTAPVCLKMPLRSLLSCIMLLVLAAGKPRNEVIRRQKELQVATNSVQSAVREYEQLNSELLVSKAHMLQMIRENRTKAVWDGSKPVTGHRHYHSRNATDSKVSNANATVELFKANAHLKKTNDRLNALKNISANTAGVLDNAANWSDVPDKHLLDRAKRAAKVAMSGNLSAFPAVLKQLKQSQVAWLRARRGDTSMEPDSAALVKDDDLIMKLVDSVQLLNSKINYHAAKIKTKHIGRKSQKHIVNSTHPTKASAQMSVSPMQSIDHRIKEWQHANLQVALAEAKLRTLGENKTTTKVKKRMDTSDINGGPRNVVQQRMDELEAADYGVAKATETLHRLDREIAKLSSRNSEGNTSEVVTAQALRVGGH